MKNHLSPRSLLAIAGFALGLAAVPLLSGCPGSLDLAPFEKAAADGGKQDSSMPDSSMPDSSMPDAPPPVCDAPTRIFTPTCAIGGCHSSSFPAAGLDLTANGLTMIYGRSSSECTGYIIDPGMLSQSLLYTKVTAATDGPCPMRMPYGQAPLSDTDQACILSWVLSQTPPSGAGGAGGGGGSGGAGGAGGG